MGTEAKLSEPHARMYPLPHIFPREWAVAYGEDLFGLWQAFEVYGVRQRLRWIASGDFWMGSPYGERNRAEDEPQHRVILSRGFWLADTTCTQALWTRVVGHNPSRFRQSDRNPVERVSRDDLTQRFLPRLNTLMPDLNATLPTEAQWEYACRADGSSRLERSLPFWWGRRASRDRMNCRGEGPFAPHPPSLMTAPVQLLPPNPWGLSEMHGNVWEWCIDGYRVYDCLNFLTEDPEGPQDTDKYVLRGGSWFNVGSRCRAAARDAQDPGFKADYVGFRVCVNDL